MLNKALQSASASAEKIYIESVFSTWLYTGNGSTQTITNGIDLSGKGGLVWLKQRSAAQDHLLVDTARGASDSLASNSSSAGNTIGNGIGTNGTFNSAGFTLGNGTAVYGNQSTYTYASWTFREAEKFFDICTWTGSGANRTISHNLGSVPGCIIVKRTDTTGDWQVYHRSLANTEYMVLNSTAAKATGATRWNSTTPTSTVFSLGTDATVNASGGTYVAYLFAHDAGGFGDSGNDSVVSCGTFTTDVSGDATVNLGWEPQWILIKNTSASENWKLVDTMRGFPNNGRGFDDNFLNPNLSTAEATDNRVGYPTATGFFVYEQYSSNNYIYIAIRRGPMKTPTDATKVFDDIARTGTGTNTTITCGFSTDLFLNIGLSGAAPRWYDRLRGYGKNILSSSTNAESTDPADKMTGFDVQDGVRVGTDSGGTVNGSGVSAVNYFLRRAPGFFDVVAYTGTGVARTVSHNLGVAPELMIVKVRSFANYWYVYHAALGSSATILLDQTSAVSTGYTGWNNTSPTSSVFSASTGVNTNGATFIAYLFATCPGVSKVGSYTGTGTTLDINCGFTAGARFVLIKRTDSTGDWYVWDTARGIISGNDPYLLLNSTAAEVTSTDYIDPLSSGFQISSTAPAAINANGGSFIYLAVA